MVVVVVAAAGLVCDSIVAVAVGIVVGHKFAVVGGAAGDIAGDVSDRVVLLHRHLLGPCCMPSYHLAFPMMLDRRTMLFDPCLSRSQRSFDCGHCCHV